MVWLMFTRWCTCAATMQVSRCQPLTHHVLQMLNRIAYLKAHDHWMLGCQKDLNLFFAEHCRNFVPKGAVWPQVAQ